MSDDTPAEFDEEQPDEDDLLDPVLTMESDDRGRVSIYWYRLNDLVRFAEVYTGPESLFATISVLGSKITVDFFQLSSKVRAFLPLLDRPTKEHVEKEFGRIVREVKRRGTD